MSEPENVIIGGVPSGVWLPSTSALLRVVHDFESVGVDDLGEGRRSMRIRVAGHTPVVFAFTADEAAHLARLLLGPSATPEADPVGGADDRDRGGGVMVKPSGTPTDAVARGVTRCGETGRPILSFVVDGEVVRYRLGEEAVAFLVGGLADLDQIGRRSHSERVSGNPTSEVSTPFEGVKV